MVIRNLLLCAGIAAAGALFGCSGEQPPTAATPASTDSVAEAQTQAAPARPEIATPTRPLSTPRMDRAVTAATNELVGAQDRCNKLTGALRDGCHKQALAFYEASIDKVRKPVQ